MMKMVTSSSPLVLLLLLLSMLAWPHSRSNAEAAPPTNGSYLAPVPAPVCKPSPIPPGVPFNRNLFPPGFIFGAGSAAYQYEGAWDEDGKGLSNWDYFTHTYPEKIKDKSNGDVALDFYHRYKEDVLLAKDIGLDAFRFSISWPRILPNGTLSGGINKAGIQHYSDLIDDIILKGMIPFVTLFHWDTPQALEESYNGFLSPLIVHDYVDYVNICFKEFGDRVKNWVTFNEPMIFTQLGYAIGINAPGRCTPGSIPGIDCVPGNSSTEPYNVTHNILLAHGAAVKLYREKYQATQNGKIGITLVTTWYVPLTDSWADFYAFQRAVDFYLGWYMDPLTHGEYPASMRTLVGDRLPKFTKEEAKLIVGSYDFITLNYYNGLYVYNVPFSTNVTRDYSTDSFANTTVFRNGVAIGPEAATDFYSYAKGLKEYLIYTKERYNNPILYITENGVSEDNDATKSIDEALNDVKRLEYLKAHIEMLYEAISEGVDVRGYMVWSLLDDFEWANGFTIRMGLHYIDFNDDLKRYPKRSSFWLRQFLKK